MAGILLSLLLITTRIRHANSACPRTWEYYDDACYKVITQRYYQTTARAKCRETSGSDLVSIHSSRENNFINRLVHRKAYPHDAWIGLQKEWSGWAWTDGTSWRYTNWNPGEPNNFPWELCVQMFGGGGWSDHRCRAECNAVCKMEYQLSPVTSLTMQPINTTAVTVQWTDPKGVYGSLEITFSASSGRNRRSVIVTQGKRSRVFGSLRPGERYQATVVTLFNGKSSNGVRTTTRLRPDSVENLKFSNIESERLRVEWINTKSIVTSFTVTATSFRRPNGASCSRPLPVRTPSSALPSRHHRDMCGLFPGALYQFKVNAVSNGQTSGPTTSVKRTRPKTPGCSISSSEETSFTVTVTLPLASSLREWYLVDTTGEDKLPRVNQSAGALDSKHITLSGYTPGSTYTLNTKAGIGLMISSRSCDITGHTLLGKATGLKVTFSTKDSLGLAWTKAPGRKDTHKVDCVTASVQGSDGSCSGHDGDTESCTCTGLRPGCLYTVTITTQRRGFTDRPADISVRNVTVPKVPEQLILSRNTLNSLDIKWTKPIGSEFTNTIISYSDTEISEKRDKRTKVITQLDPNTAYAVSIWNRANYSGIYRDSSFINDTFWTLPHKPQSLDILEARSRNLHVSWAPVTTDHVQGYILIVSDPNGCVQRRLFKTSNDSIILVQAEFLCVTETEEVIENNSTITYNITGLVPLTNYTLRVVTVNPGGQSAFTEKSATTEEDTKGIPFRPLPSSQGTNWFLIVGLCMLPVFGLMVTITIVFRRIRRRNHREEIHHNYNSLNMDKMNDGRPAEDNSPAKHVSLNTDKSEAVNADDVIYEVIPDDALSEQLLSEGKKQEEVQSNYNSLNTDELKFRRPADENPTAPYSSLNTDKPEAVNEGDENYYASPTEGVKRQPPEEEKHQEEVKPSYDSLNMDNLRDGCGAGENAVASYTALKNDQPEAFHQEVTDYYAIPADEISQQFPGKGNHQEEVKSSYDSPNMENVRDGRRAGENASAAYTALKTDQPEAVHQEEANYDAIPCVADSQQVPDEGNYQDEVKYNNDSLNIDNKKKGTHQTQMPL